MVECDYSYDTDNDDDACDDGCDDYDDYCDCDDDDEYDDDVDDDDDDILYLVGTVWQVDMLLLNDSFIAHPRVGMNVYMFH